MDTPEKRFIFIDDEREPEVWASIFRFLENTQTNFGVLDEAAAMVVRRLVGGVPSETVTEAPAVSLSPEVSKPNETSVPQGNEVVARRSQLPGEKIEITPGTTLSRNDFYRLAVETDGPGAAQRAWHLLQRYFTDKEGYRRGYTLAHSEGAFVQHIPVRFTVLPEPVERQLWDVERGSYVNTFYLESKDMDGLEITSLQRLMTLVDQALEDDSQQGLARLFHFGGVGPKTIAVWRYVVAQTKEQLDS